MAKQVSKKSASGTTNAAPVQAPVASGTTVAAKAQAPTVAGIVHVVPGKSFKAGRKVWYDFALKYDNKPLAELVAEAEKNPPTNFGARSMFAGKAKPGLRGIRFLRRMGLLTVT